MTRVSELVVQLGHPKIRMNARGRPALSLGHLLTEAHRPFEESIYLFWCGIPVAIRYVPDLARSIDDLLAIAWLVGRQPSGQCSVHIDGHLVAFEIAVTWDNEVCHLEASFKAHDDLFDAYADALGARPRISLSRRELLRELRTILHQVNVIVAESERVITEGRERRKRELLARVDESIPGVGVLYERQP